MSCFHHRRHCVQPNITITITIIVVGDLCSPEDVLKACQGVTHVIHTASPPHGRVCCRSMHSKASVLAARVCRCIYKHLLTMVMIRTRPHCKGLRVVLQGQCRRNAQSDRGLQEGGRIDIGLHIVCQRCFRWNGSQRLVVAMMRMTVAMAVAMAMKMAMAMTDWLPGRASETLLHR
jgi:hypothetical protein